MVLGGTVCSKFLKSRDISGLEEISKPLCRKTCAKADLYPRIAVRESSFISLKYMKKSANNGIEALRGSVCF